MPHKKVYVIAATLVVVFFLSRYITIVSVVIVLGNEF